MMKKFLAILLVLIMSLSLVACGGNGDGDNDNEGVTGDGDGETTEAIAMITDVGTIDDKSFNQGTWEGIVAYAEGKDIPYRYYQPTEQTTDAYLAMISQAIDGGATVIVTPGYLFEEPIYLAQDIYPDVHFILIDGNPNDGDQVSPTYYTAPNTVGVVYAEEESGYLAGYAAVKDGYTKLGFMGGMAVPAVVRFGYGFAQGADDAAKELEIDNIELKYHYTNDFSATPEATATAASWYAQGTEVIFACGGAVGSSVMSAAAVEDKAVIGVDIDQSEESDTVITSAMKGLAASVEAILDDYFAGNFPGGKGLVFGASEDGVQLPMDTSKFETFTKADYDEVYARLAAGGMNLQNDESVTNAAELDLDVVAVTLID